MKISQVKKMAPLDRLLYWISERHKIHVKRSKGIIKPWTDDEVLQYNFFTNPYRENDKTTQWFRKNIRDPLNGDDRVAFATILFRMFNLIETGKLFIKNGLTVRWNELVAKDLLKRRWKNGEKIVTGAYMVSTDQGMPKYESLCNRVTKVWLDREWMFDEFSADCSLENFHHTLMQFDGIGPFNAYEIVCDLRYTHLLEDAYDIDTWCNIGPGCRRGLYRINEIEFDSSRNSSMLPELENELEQMEDLLETVRYYLPDMPKFELREVEHSLCEFDKYERCLWKQGKSKRGYKGV